MRWVFLVVLAVSVAGCGGTICRDKAVYEQETKFEAQMALQPAEQLLAFVKAHCACDAEGEFTTPECQKAAETALTATTRSPWHRDMALFNGGLLKERPPREPPVIPAAKTLCPGGAP